ncbi:MAG: hypothetical protein Q9187_005787 [Circinaria calcarea]
MAEAIGTTAALLSLLEYSFKALGVVSKLRDAPKTVHELALQMKQLHQTISAIQANPALNTDTVTLEPMLLLCLDDVKIVRTQLSKVTCDLSDGVLGKSWKSLVGVIKEKSIKALCDKLERHKSTLTLYMANKNVVLLSDIVVKVTSMQHSVNAMTPRFQDSADVKFVTMHELETIKAISSKPAALAAELGKFNSVLTAPSCVDNLSPMRRDNIAARDLSEDLVVEGGGVEWRSVNPPKVALHLSLLEEIRNHHRRKSTFPTEFSGLARSTQLVEELQTDFLPGDGNGESINSSKIPYSLQFPHGSTTHIGRTCRCFQKIRSTATWGSSESILGSGSLFFGRHRANCPLKISERGIHSCLRYALPRWLLNLTVEAQFKMTCGAGGFSLPSSLVLKYTVSDQSPMIRLLSTFRYESRQERTQNPILPRVRNLFLEGKASPSDVDASGNNYLNYLLEMPEIVFNGDLQLFLELILFLIRSGIDINQVNFAGQSPLCQAMTTFWAFSSLETVLNVLQREGATFISTTPELVFRLHVKDDMKRLNPYLAWRDGICYLRNQKSIAEDSELYGPLSLAVIVRSLVDVRNLLRNHIGFDEKNAYGQTPLHLCGDWSPGTEALLAAGHAYNSCDSLGLRPLDYALAFGGTEAASLLLSVGCMLACQHSMEYCTTRGFSSWYFFNRDLESQQNVWPFHSNWYALVEVINTKRKALAKTARRYLPQELLLELERCGTDVDDTRAIETEKTLVQHAIIIPTSIQTSRVSIYHSIYMIEAAQHLFATGFRDLNAYDHLGYTPLMTCVSRTVYSVSQYERRLPLLEWMLQHGANPLKLHRDLHTNALHEALRLVWYDTIGTSSMRFFGASTSLGRWPLFGITNQVVSGQGITSSFLPPLALRLLREVSPSSHDQCRCPCSPSGCTPTTILHKYGMPGHSAYQQMRLVYEWLNAIASLNGPVKEVCKELYRLHEFDNLGLTHTCCRDTYPSVRLLDPDDVLEIQDEEEEMIARLEKTMGDYDNNRHFNRNGNPNWAESYWSELVWNGPPPTFRRVQLRDIHDDDG